jgi:hypothetical protein
VNQFPRRVPKKHFFLLKKPFFESGEDGRKQARANIEAVIKQRSSVMSAFLTLIYREYCKARLAEMRKHHLGG